MKYWRATLAIFAALSASLVLVIATVCEAQSPLDAPGEKKVTVRSEIARGVSEIFSAANEKHDISLVYLEGDLAQVIIDNKSRQKDSDGFMLGAHVEQVQQIDILLRSGRREQFNTPEQIATAYNDCRAHVAEIRNLQKRLGIDDDAMISAFVTKPEGFSRIKALLASYER